MFRRILEDNITKHVNITLLSNKSRHHCKLNIFFFFNKGKEMKTKGFLNFSTRNNTEYINNQNILHSLNLKLTSSSMFKQMHVNTRDKSLNESTREKERKHLVI